MLAISLMAAPGFSDEDGYPEFETTEQAEVDAPCPTASAYRTATSFASLALTAELQDFEDVCGEPFDYEVFTISDVPELPSHGVLNFSIESGNVFLAVFDSDGNLLDHSSRACQLSGDGAQVDILVSPADDEGDYEDSFQVFVANNCYANTGGPVDYPATIDLEVTLEEFQVV